MNTMVEKLAKEKNEINAQIEMLNKIIMEKSARRVEIENKISDILDKEEQNNQETK